MAVVTDSTNIQAVGYAQDIETMRVRFRDGSEYEFYDVAPTTFTELMGAKSIGSHFAVHIKGQYKTWRIRRPRPQHRAS